MQSGSIVGLNSKRGMFIVAIEGGDYAVFELLDGIDLSIGDRIHGDLGALGSGFLLHQEQQRKFSVYGQSGPSSLNACRRLL